MDENIKFMELSKEEKILLLKAFDYDVDQEDNILNQSHNKIESLETPNTYLNIDNAFLIPSSLDVVDGTPTSIASFIRSSQKKQL